MPDSFLSGVLKAGSTIGAPLERAGSAVARGVENVATLGERTHPGSVRQYVGAQAHAFNPSTPTGAVNLADILSGGKIPETEIPSSVPGITITRAKHGDMIRDNDGRAYRYPRRPGSPELYSWGAPGEMPSQGRGVNLAYNAKDERGNIVGTIDMTVHHDHTYVNSVYVNKRYKLTPIFAELGQFAMATKKPIHADVINPKLFQVISRLLSRRGQAGVVHAPHGSGLESLNAPEGSYDQPLPAGLLHSGMTQAERVAAINSHFESLGPHIGPGAGETYDEYMNRIGNPGPPGGWPMG